MSIDCGYDANALYLWAIMQDMPTGWYTRRREENKFRPQQAQRMGRWPSSGSRANRTERDAQSVIRVMAAKSELGSFRSMDGVLRRAPPINSMDVSGTVARNATRTPEETNPKNNKTMAELLANTKAHTAYLRRHVKVVEMWECAWKRERDPPPHQKWKMTQQQIIAAVVDGTLFGMVECDVRVPEHLQDQFAEMQPIFKNANVSRDDIGPFMRQYAEEHDIMSTPRRMLVGSYHGEKILLTTPLLRWYLAHGLVVDRVYRSLSIHRNHASKISEMSVSAARRAGDADPDKAIIADTMKLLGNSGYGKTVTNIDRHREVKYCTEVGTSSHISNRRFCQLDVVTEDATK